jgi:tetratricopeptide (TPR) repeat protein
MRAEGWNNLSKAREMILEALKLDEGEGDRLSVLAATARSNLAIMELALGDAPAALDHFLAALPVIRAWRSSTLPNVLSNGSTILIALGRYDEARNLALESLRMLRRRGLDAPALAIDALQRLAVVGALCSIQDGEDRRSRRLRAASVLGFVFARVAALGLLREPTDQQEADRAVASLRQELGEATTQRLTTEGASLGEDEAIGLALLE